MRLRTDRPPASSNGGLARRVRQRLQRFVTGSAFLPVSIVVVCVLMALTGTQVAGLYRIASASGWWVYHDPVTLTGPGIDGASTTVQVFVLGAVEMPGAYELPAGSRVADLVTAAGGLLPSASAQAVNETETLSQGQQVYVPYLGQPPAGGSSVLVNINTASAAELHASLGITSQTADNIVAFRGQHGPFTEISQLLLVPVTRTTFDRIKYLITV